MAKQSANQKMQPVDPSENLAGRNMTQDTQDQEQQEQNGNSAPKQLSNEEAIARVQELLFGEGGWEDLNAEGESLRAKLQEEMNKKLAAHTRQLSNVVQEIASLGYSGREMKWTAPDGTQRVTRGIRERRLHNGKGESAGTPIEGGPLYSFMFKGENKDREVVEF